MKSDNWNAEQSAVEREVMAAVADEIIELLVQKTMSIRQAKAALAIAESKLNDRVSTMTLK